MRKILIALFLVCSVLSGYAQNKTALHYWGRVPQLPTASRESFLKFMDECEVLRSEISEEADKQTALVEQKVGAFDPAAMQLPQNMDPAAIQKMMKKIEERTKLMEELSRQSEALKKQLDAAIADYEKAYAAKVKPLQEKAKKICPNGAMGFKDEARVPACDAVLKEMDDVRANLLSVYFLNSQSPFQGYLAAKAAWIKKTEPLLIKLRDESFVGTGINVKGLPCAETIKEVSSYLAELKHVFQKPLDDYLVK